MATSVSGCEADAIGRELIEALRDLIVEVRGLRAILDRQSQRATLTRADRALLARLLPAIVGAFGSEPFASRDLCTTPGTRVVLRDVHVKQIGKLLAKAEGVPISGHVVEHGPVEINVRLWRVLQTMM